MGKKQEIQDDYIWMEYISIEALLQASRRVILGAKTDNNN